MIRPGIASCFFGPVYTDEIVALLALDDASDQERGSGHYGDRWRLPLDHRARADLGDRLALLRDRRRGVGLADGLPDIDWVEIDGGQVTIEIEPTPGKEGTLRAEPSEAAALPAETT